MKSAEQYMLRCLELAQLGLSQAAPNPSVGCVIVHNGKIIGEGYTDPYGGDHAEVNAIKSVTDDSKLKDATIYVSLEPCAHFGKTPPCANLIIKKGIKKAVIGCQDPFAQVNGAGIRRLKESGVEVELGILENECLELNKRFITFHGKKRPYIVLKWSETFDGFVDSQRTDPNESALKITSETANILVHKWRSEESAIMVGKNTAVLDNPSLTTRKFEGKNPIRILLDAELESDPNLKLFDGTAPTLVYHSTDDTPRNTAFECIQLKNTNNLKEVLSKLYSRNILSVIVEGGPTLHRSFYDAGLWDEIRRFVAPVNIGNGVPALSVSNKPEAQSLIGVDQLFIYRNR